MTLSPLQRPHLLISSQWELGFNMNFAGYTNSNHGILPLTPKIHVFLKKKIHGIFVYGVYSFCPKSLNSFQYKF